MFICFYQLPCPLMYHQERPVYVIITNYLQISMISKNRILFFVQDTVSCACLWLCYAIWHLGCRNSSYLGANWSCGREERGVVEPYRGFNLCSGETHRLSFQFIGQSESTGHCPLSGMRHAISHLERQCKRHGQVSYQHGRKIHLSSMVKQ